VRNLRGAPRGLGTFRIPALSREGSCAHQENRRRFAAGSLVRPLHQSEVLMLRLVRSLLAGGAATVADLATLALLVSFIHLDPRAASLPALLAGAAVQFFANRHFVFRAQRRRGSLARQAILFVLVEAVALLLNGVLYDHAMRVAPPSLYAVVRLVASNLVYVGFSYPLWRFVFRTNRTTRPWTRSPSSPRTS
jgi:putative flippase GtrA